MTLTSCKRYGFFLGLLYIYGFFLLFVVCFNVQSANGKFLAATGNCSDRMPILSIDPGMTTWKLTEVDAANGLYIVEVQV